MSLMLDTCACIEAIRRPSSPIVSRLCRQRVGTVAISTITLAELWHGVARSASVERNRAALEAFVLPLVVVPFDEAAAETYGRVRASLDAAGTPIGPLDTLIGSHALTLDATLVTANTRELGRIAGLRVEDWCRDGTSETETTSRR